MLDGQRKGGQYLDEFRKHPTCSNHDVGCVLVHPVTIYFLNFEEDEQHADLHISS